MVGSVFNFWKALSGLNNRIRITIPNKIISEFTFFNLTKVIKKRKNLSYTQPIWGRTRIRFSSEVGSRSDDIIHTVCESNHSFLCFSLSLSFLSCQFLLNICLFGEIKDRFVTALDSINCLKETKEQRLFLTYHGFEYYLVFYQFWVAEPHTALSEVVWNSNLSFYDLEIFH